MLIQFLCNSYVGREAEEDQILPAEKPKNLLAAGTGPAGCEFAYRAAARGHHVTIWEKEGQIGGTIPAAAAPPAEISSSSAADPSDVKPLILPFQEDFNVLFNACNVDKKSLVLDLKDEDGKEALMKLLAAADVLLTNTREEVLERLGFAFDQLHEKFPKLIIGNVIGFGTKGPDKGKRGYDATSFRSPSGMTQEWNFEDNNYAFKPFYGLGGAIAASQLTTGIMTALYNREKPEKEYYTGIPACYRIMDQYLRPAALSGRTPVPETV